VKQGRASLGKMAPLGWEPIGASLLEVRARGGACPVSTQHCPSLTQSTSGGRGPCPDVCTDQGHPQLLSQAVSSSRQTVREVDPPRSHDVAPI
jgi:hypothetical protein